MTDEHTTTAKSHTDGPWFVSENPVLAVVAREGHPTIAEVTALSDREHGFGCEFANARLIAAAPELLAICVEFVRRVDAGEVRSKRTYAAMKSAIARATGAK